MNEQEQRKLLNRLQRLAGQVRSLQNLVIKNDQPQVITQLEAVIASAKSTLVAYLQVELLSKEELTEVDRQTLQRLLTKF